MFFKYVWKKTCSNLRSTWLNIEQNWERKIQLERTHATYQFTRELVNVRDLEKKQQMLSDIPLNIVRTTKSRHRQVQLYLEISKLNLAFSLMASVHCVCIKIQTLPLREILNRKPYIPAHKQCLFTQIFEDFAPEGCLTSFILS